MFQQRRCSPPCPSRAGRLGSCSALSSIAPSRAILLGATARLSELERMQSRSRSPAACCSSSASSRLPRASGRLAGATAARGGFGRSVTGRWGGKGIHRVRHAPWFAPPEPCSTVPGMAVHSLRVPAWRWWPWRQGSSLAHQQWRPADCVNGRSVGQRVVDPLPSAASQAVLREGQALFWKSLRWGAAALRAAWWLLGRLKSWAAWPIRRRLCSLSQDPGH